MGSTEVPTKCECGAIETSIRYEVAREIYLRLREPAQAPPANPEVGRFLDSVSKLETIVGITHQPAIHQDAICTCPMECHWAHAEGAQAAHLRESVPTHDVNPYDPASVQAGLARIRRGEKA